MKIERPIYMQQLIDSKDNGLIKIVTCLISCRIAVSPYHKVRSNVKL